MSQVSKGTENLFEVLEGGTQGPAIDGLKLLLLVNRTLRGASQRKEQQDLAAKAAPMTFTGALGSAFSGPGGGVDMENSSDSEDEEEQEERVRSLNEHLARLEDSIKTSHALEYRSLWAGRKGGAGTTMAAKMEKEEQELKLELFEVVFFGGDDFSLHQGEGSLIVLLQVFPQV